MRTLYLPKSISLLASLIGLAATGRSCAEESYTFDPGFATYYRERFAGTGAVPGSAHGRKSAVLSNGDIVTVGGVALTGQPAPYGNVMLSRRLPNGNETPWVLVPSDVLRYPDLASGDTSRIVGIHDIAAEDGKIFVLTTRRFFESPRDDDAEVLIFDETGAYRATVVALGSTSNESARALHVTRNVTLANSTVITVVAEVADPAVPGHALVGVAKITQDAAGLFQRDPSFGNGQSAPGTMLISLPDSLCAPTALPCTAAPVGVTRPFRFPGGDSAPIYLGASRRYSGGDWDFLAIKLTANGELDASFNNGGFLKATFDQSGGDLGDFASAIVASGVAGGQSYDSASIWMVGNVSRSCAPGIGLFKFSAQGVPDVAFGNLGSGRGLIGGSSAPLCLDNAPDLAFAAALQGTRLAIAGQLQYHDVAQPPNLYGDGLLAVIEGGNGNLVSLNALEYNASPGARFGDSALYGVIGTGAGKFLVSGEGVDSLYGSSFITARVRSDRIFAHGFE